jgi:hypothetical protein
MVSTTTWRLVTPAERAGAIAMVQLRGEIEGALGRLGIGGVAPGEVRLRDLAGVDRGLVARVADDLAFLMPHGGTEIVRALCCELERAGVHRDEDGSPPARFPEASGPFEAALLDTLARAASPRALDLLLDQPRRWAEAGRPDPAPETPAPDEAHSRMLDRLVTPPLVVAVGPTNVGKSTLLNRLAGRAVAVVADEPGTTRDHVGSLIDLDGLVVRYIDTPGVRPGATPAETEAVRIVGPLVQGADLLLRLGDATGAAPPAPQSAGAVLTVGLRSDLGLPDWRRDLDVSARTGEGVGALRIAARRALVPDAALEAATPWRFWG